MTGCSGPPEPFGDSTVRLTSPSLLSAPAGLAVATLANTEQCTGCHDDVASLWSHSAHAHASFDNPWYRASVDAFREARGERASRFCAGCHDPLLLISGDIDREVTADQDLAFAGVTCLVCHSVESATNDGNASLTLTERPVVIPDPAVPEEIEAHRRRMAMPVLRTAALCGSCHQSFSGIAIGNENHLPGIDDLGAWTVSAYSGAASIDATVTAPKTCQSCHMRDEPAPRGDLAGRGGRVAGHRWAASHTALSAQLAAGAQYQATVDSLISAAVLDLGAVEAGTRRFEIPEEALLRPGDPVVLEMLLQNRSAGHRFPGGTRDMHDVWLEVEVFDATGRAIGVSRRGDQNAADEVFELKSTLLDEHGDPETLHRVHRFATAAFDRTLAPHGAQIVRYAMTLPRNVVLPIRVEARLLHRKHTLDFQQAACERSQTVRGRAFAAGALQRGKAALDPCIDQPVTTLSTSSTFVGRAARRRNDELEREVAIRLLAHSRALLGERQERVSLAGPGLRRAAAWASTVGDDEMSAEIEIVRGRLASLEGRPDEALASLGRAEDILGPAARLDRVRGDALARVWRWEEAALAYRRVVDAAPGDSSAWRGLAQALGSLSANREALTAAERGLAIAPNDEALLRSRWLALAALGDSHAATAEAAWLSRRPADSTAAALRTCEQAHQRCATDRQPIPHYALRRPP